MLTKGKIDSATQEIKMRLKTFSGEWFLDQNEGLPYLQEILGKKHSKLYLSTLLRDAIAKCSEVERVEIRDLEFDEGSRTYKLWFEATLASGEKLQFKGLEGAYV